MSLERLSYFEHKYINIYQNMIAILGLAINIFWGLGGGFGPTVYDHLMKLRIFTSVTNKICTGASKIVRKVILASI